MRAAPSSSTSPSGVETTTPIAAGPGLPRAPPSTWTRSRKSDGGELPGNPGAAAVAGLALLPTRRRPALAPLALAPVDDDLDVGVVRVVGGELVVQLIRQLVG